MAGTRGVKWRIEQEEGEFDVRQGRTRRRTFGDLEEAIGYVLRAMQPGDTVYQVEPDGYETRLRIRPDARLRRR